MDRPVRSTSDRRALLACGVIGPVLFVVVFLVEGAVRPGYNPLRHPVSSLAIGEPGWVQRADFLVAGALVLAFAVGLAPVVRRWGGGIWSPLLIGLVGAGLMGAGVFVTDPISGYPPGTPMQPLPPTTDGALHQLFSTPVFTALPAAGLVLAYRFAKLGNKVWAAYSAASAVAFLIAFVLTSLGFAQNPALMPVGGLLQRLTIIIGFAWLAALATYLLRRGAGASAD
ncbi:DUF998 domain-containing protein [Nonomuraea sp. M3C6]|uniref:DUF998 domain-containing protein n=1 Tax=Nonomuraea marmarensis TaxID=3351344 RepID=A0ABW7AA13_9ACTN